MGVFAFCPSIELSPRYESHFCRRRAICRPMHADCNRVEGTYIWYADVFPRVANLSHYTDRGSTSYGACYDTTV